MVSKSMKTSSLCIPAALSSLKNKRTIACLPSRGKGSCGICPRNVRDGQATKRMFKSQHGFMTQAANHGQSRSAKSGRFNSTVTPCLELAVNFGFFHLNGSSSTRIMFLSLFPMAHTSYFQAGLRAQARSSAAIMSRGNMHCRAEN